MSHPFSIALALLITFAAVGDASAAFRFNFSPARFFCGLAKGFCVTHRKRTHTNKVARKPSARAVAKVEPAPKTAPPAVAATTKLAPQPEAEQTAVLLVPIPVPRPVRPPSLAEPNAAAPGAAAAVLPPAAGVMSNNAMPDRQKFFERRESYRKLAKAEALRQGVPFPLVDAVMKVESGYDPRALGEAGEIGLMQLIPETAALLGFQGTVLELAEPTVNITLGTTYLARAWSLAKQDVCTAVMKYRAGLGESRFSQLSVTYCERVRAQLLVRGFPVTGSLPKVDLVPVPSVSTTGPR
jgi:soluble lytic murein transglycosylase-like protein